MTGNPTDSKLTDGVENAAPDLSDIDKGHPRGLYSLFFVEMWERFSYYGMRALLVLYMVGYHGWQPSQASVVYKWYTSLVYLTPIFGGFLADRFLGLRNSIIIGCSLMAAGHFLMAFEQIPIFFAALVLLILGNGFFKPNMSTLIGRMYKKGDPRRDGAFTIFYMGINLGAFLSPIACGYLRQNYGFHYGFTLAGVGMLVGMVIFLVTQKQVIADVEAAGNTLRVQRKQAAANGEVLREPDEAKPGVAGVAGFVTKVAPWVINLLTLALHLFYWKQYMAGEAKVADLVMTAAFVLVFAWMNANLHSIKGAARDKATVIFVLFLFAVLFWMAFEQAGNALNLWAEYQTHLSAFGFHYPAEWWQSVNAVLIFTLAPLFSLGWVALAKKGKEPSTPMKMAWAMGFMALAFATMVVGAKMEDGGSVSQPLEELPATTKLQSVDAGRLTFDAQKKELTVRGVLPHYDANELLIKTVDKAFVDEIASLEELTRQASVKEPVVKKLDKIPAGFAFPYSEEEAKQLGVRFDAASATLTFTASAGANVRNELTVAGGEARLRDSLRALEKKSNVFRVSGWWLFLQYLFATLGELCLSPVGLSMVTKLAPMRFASLFMGVWLLSSSMAQYLGGTIGESWGKIVPVTYFWIFVFSSLGGLAVLLSLVRALRKMMHEVH